MSTAAEYKGQMQSDGTNDELLPLKPTRMCICCMKEYEREKSELYRPLGVFENYCICEDCLYKDKHGWGKHQ